MQALIDYMRTCDINQEALSRRIGCSPTQLNHWLRGRRSPSAENLKAIWQATGVSLELLLREVKATGKHR